MNDQNNHHAMLLLTQDLSMGKPANGPRPLSIDELADLENRLYSRGWDYGDLLTSSDSELHDERISALLGRSFLMAIAIDKWETCGIAVYSRNQPEYPTALLSRMRQQAPPVVYCVGDRAALHESALAILPPRTRDPEVINFASRMGGAMTQAGATLVSGLGKLSEAALVEAASKTLAVTRGSLEKAALDRRYREPLINGRLTLVSAADPTLGQKDEAVDNLVRAFAKQVVLIDPGPPPAWRYECQAE